MKIPSKFDTILKTNQTLYSIVLDVITSFQPILEDNKLYFFEEYTDHGINHIERVLKSSEFIIKEESFDNITAHEVAYLTLGIILHDIGMHIELSVFKSLIDGKYDNVKVDVLDDKTWKELWLDYLSEVKRFNSNQKRNIFGNPSIPFKIPDLSNKDNLTGYDKKLIGEFIRRYHGRFAHEIALGGLKTQEQTLTFGTDKLDEKSRQLIGLLARSHSMNIRDTFIHLKELAHDSWRNPKELNIIYLMVIIRIADYIQIDAERVNPYLLKLKSFNSPISQLEHNTHLAISSLNFKHTDDELIYADCSPKDSEQYIKIKNLLIDIQNEFDISWAILGEIYGFIPKDKPAIKFRRITSNLTNKDYLRKLEFVPEKISFKVDSNLSKLLVSPLYGDNPTFGVRELLQNAIDACMERKEIEYQEQNYSYKPTINVSIKRVDDSSNIFTIKDNGKGMNESEIINYFLNVGSTFRKSMDWKKKFVDDNGKAKVSRTGKFGIGVLASFLLGDEICVISKSLDGNVYTFKTTIDSEFVNITKNEIKKDFGVEISILIDNEKREKLLLNKDRKWNDQSIRWNKWYIYNEPEIIFEVDGKILISKEDFSPQDFYDFQTTNFDKISWGYIKQNESFDTTIACNGIIITKGYRTNNFIKIQTHYHYLDKKHKVIDNNLNFIITRKPSVLVNDKEGLFPVKLDRNDIDCDEYPFEKELLMEVSKKFIADLLNLEVTKGNFKFIKNLHNTEILYGKNGFTINCDYFIEGIKNEYKFIRLITDKNTLKFNIDDYENTIFKIDYNESIKLSFQESKVAPFSGGRVLISKINFNNLFKTTKKRLPKYVLNGVKIENETENYVLYNLYDYKEPRHILTDINNIDKDILTKTLSIQEINYRYFQKKGGVFLTELLSKYIKEDFIIPYDISERKKIYKEAFNELDCYVKK